MDDLSRWIRILNQKPGSEEICKEDASEIEISLRALNNALAFMGNTDGRDQLERLVIDLSWPLKDPATGYKPKSNETIKSFLERARIAIYNEMEARKFVYIPESQHAYFENNRLFGESVYENFKSARDDIENAGNCLAADLPTAAVFHLMRVAEFGMRALAKHLKVKITKQKREQKCPHCKRVISDAGKPVTTPVEYAMWDEVLKELKKKIVSLENAKKGPCRTENFRFYHGLLDDLQKFKNVDRNEIMHSRRSYGADEADVVFNSVKKFMVSLSNRVMEPKK